MTIKVLELFSGTGSISKGVKTIYPDSHIVSLDRDIHNPHSEVHIQEDIMTWDYKSIDKYSFDLITASPVCMWWSNLRNTWINRKLKIHGDKIITKEILEDDINKYGVPMVNKVIEIIKYFEPKHFWIENPHSSSMKRMLDPIYPKHKVSYCQYGFDYQKNTSFWMDDELHNRFVPRCCHKDCNKIVKNPKSGRSKKGHIGDLGTYYGGSNRLLRYRIPIDLICSLIESCEFNN